MSNPRVSINLVILNGEKYIHHCLNGILVQTYPRELIEFNILDNGSTDKTTSIIKNNKFLNINLIESRKNLGMWPGQEELLKHSNGKYILAMAVDVILDEDFIKNAVRAMEEDANIGALEAKVFKYDLVDGRPSLTKVIDTLGFQIFKSRRVVNIGHGDTDKGQFNFQKEIFGVEGACPFFRRTAMEDIRIDGRFCDHDYFWYGDDLDISWRMNLFGWKQIFEPTVIAWHDRQTTKSLKRGYLDYLTRVPLRSQIPIQKRRLDWRNTRFTIIKNDYIINILRDLPYILGREMAVFGYTLIFEPKIFMELKNFIRLLPRMISRRKEIMSRAKVSSSEIKKWFK